MALLESPGNMQAPRIVITAKESGLLKLFRTPAFAGASPQTGGTLLKAALRPVNQ